MSDIVERLGDAWDLLEDDQPLTVNDWHEVLGCIKDARLEILQLRAAVATWSGEWLKERESHLRSIRAAEWAATNVSTHQSPTKDNQP